MPHKKVHGRENDSVTVVAATKKSEVSLREEAMLRFWNEHDIFNKTVETPAGSTPKGEYIFYDGPPFATGLPHYGHILAGTIKDAIPRFWTMQGYRVRRQWGWDCHGLPVENLIEKKLGLATKRDIEVFGVKEFNQTARDSVMEYADDWRKVVPRMGRFVDMENDYKTMDSSYTESVWWVFKQLHEKGLVFEGFKSMHLCPRCGTTLSNFEVNQGYKDIKDISVFVEFPLVDEPNVSLVAWTTTPWTLPGNMALAVGRDFEYAEVEIVMDDGKTKRLLIAKERVAAVCKDRSYTIVGARKGSELLGKKYEPPFPWLKEQLTEDTVNAWTVLHADFVEVGEEGTGIVHIAPAYGEDDMKLGQEHGLPLIHHVDEAGHFKDFVTDFAGQLVKPKDNDEAEVNHMDADIEVIRALAALGKLFAKEKISHSYPHCWRCETPLLNYATNSWFVNVPKIKDELVAANEKVNWVPDHVGTNRFGKWLEGARDWAVSRQRYWGAPLPIWRNPETNTYKVFGSLAELQAYVPAQNNSFMLMRHGEAMSNLENKISANRDGRDSLTTKGEGQVQQAAQTLREKKIDLIIHSGYERTKQTAEIVAQELGLSSEQVMTDERIAELQPGIEMEGKTWADYQALFESNEDSFNRRIVGCENRMDVAVRVGQFLYDCNQKYEGKTILIVGHASSLFGLRVVAAGLSREEAAALKAHDGLMHNAEVRELPFTPLPHNDEFTLDFHRPFIDDFVLEENGVKLVRVPDVFDCWFESGSMPYAQFHYPFACADTFQTENFPAQFIAEGLDQTRGWFYSLLVLGVALFGKSPFENVIVNGLVLAEDGKKMSKSLQNYPDPGELADRVGVDAMRFYLLASPVIRGEDLSFSEKEVLELQRKNIGRLHNVLALYEMYAATAAEEMSTGAANSDSTHVLDRWIIARLNQLILETTAGYKNYELDKATRPLTDFIDDLSVWYVRRSRERLKGDDVADKEIALATLRHVLRTVALLMAPVMPFYAEYLWQRVKEDKDIESVHLGEWPEHAAVDAVVLGEMSLVREFVTLALEARTKAGVKVRQPLQKLAIHIEMADEYAQIIADEINVKAVQYDSALTDRIKLDTKLTDELVAEGFVRELMRAVQEERKNTGLEPQDSITIEIDTQESGRAAILAHETIFKKTIGATTIQYTTLDNEPMIFGEYRVAFVTHKV